MTERAHAMAPVAAASAKWVLPVEALSLDEVIGKVQELFPTPQTTHQPLTNMSLVPPLLDDHGHRANLA